MHKSGRRGGRRGAAALAAMVLVLSVGIGSLSAARAPMAPPGVLQSAEVRRLHRDGVHIWREAYQVELGRSGELTAVIRVRLDPEEGVSAGELADAQRRWSQAIDEVWSNRFALVCPQGAAGALIRRVLLRVEWVASGEHHRARAVPGRGRSTKVLWRTVGSEGDVAHEIGHFMGNDDEYPDRLAPARIITDAQSIMSNTVTGVAQPRHLESLAAWLSQETGCPYQVIGIR